MRIFSLFCFALGLFAISCSPQKNAANNYLQNVADTLIKDSMLFQKPLIEKNDLLSIRVYSTAIGSRPEVDAPYNLTGNEGAVGFLVDPEGNIEYPQIGKIHVEGLTREQLAELIKKKLEGQLNQPTVIVRYLNFRITLLGEVSRPSTYTVPMEHITILEAMGLAGDVTEFGRKDNIKIIRENNGAREIGTIDLTSRDVFNSPYFYLKQNDVILVEQNRRRIRQQEEQTVVQQISIATSILTALALILNLVK